MCRRCHQRGEFGNCFTLLCGCRSIICSASCCDRRSFNSASKTDESSSGRPYAAWRDGHINADNVGLSTQDKRRICLCRLRRCGRSLLLRHDRNGRETHTGCEDDPEKTVNELTPVRLWSQMMAGRLRQRPPGNRIFHPKHVSPRWEERK